VDEETLDHMMLLEHKIANFGSLVQLWLGVLDEPLQFEVVWPHYDDHLRAWIDDAKAHFFEIINVKNPRLVATPGITISSLQRHEARLQSPSWIHRDQWHHRKIGQRLGKGSFGEVHKTVNLHTGDYYAVKSLQRPAVFTTEQAWKEIIMQEVTILNALRHDHFAEYHHSQGFELGTPLIEIFMTLYQGSVERLVHQDVKLRGDVTIIENVTKHILRALMYLAKEGLIHRDVKPDNILVESIPVGEPTKKPTKTTHKYLLADFGLSKNELIARTQGVGTPLFQAPELFRGGEQTHKMDVFSLGVSILYLVNAGRIAEVNPSDRMQVERAIFHAMRDGGGLEAYRDMLEFELEKRYSAQQYLLKLVPGDPEALDSPPLHLEAPHRPASYQAAWQGPSDMSF
ncbi:MAG: hypothetical protein Q9195_009255, partial [Heterodermia aff. obscurata]